MILQIEDREVLVDDADSSLIEGRAWRILRTEWGDYAVCGRSTLMHRLIMGAERGVIIDHRNHNTLDNQRHNLRKSTPSQSNCNQKLRSDSTTGIKGVKRVRDNKTGRISFRGIVRFEGRTHQKRFVRAEDAGAWAAAKREEIHREFAYDIEQDERIA